jgi:hypothetical protein
MRYSLERGQDNQGAGRFGKLIICFPENIVAPLFLSVNELYRLDRCFDDVS